jgi:thioredoxin-dependent peroxiredoxin
LAEYRDQYQKIRAAGGDVAAITVDERERSESVKHGLGLPFPILCDTQRAVVKAWGVLNSDSRGGIAEPAVFIVDRDRRIRFTSRDGESKRVPAEAVAELLAGETQADAISRRTLVPGARHWLRAAASVFRFGMKSPQQ